MTVVTKFLPRAVVLTAVTLAGLGCVDSKTPVSPPRSDPSSDLERAETGALLDATATARVLSEVTKLPELMAARAWLERQGYVYVDSNSLVLVHRVRDQRSAAFEPTSLGRRSRVPYVPRHVVRCDTVSWLAFENPAHDSANHTAVLHFSNGIRAGSFLIELDIATGHPAVIRQGYFEEGEWHEADIGTEGWLACMAGGLAGSIVRCSMTNCGFGHCMGAGTAVSLAACTAVALWDWLSK